MTQPEFEKSLIAAAAWQLSSSSDINEMLAVACVIRNYVLRLGCRSYAEAINRIYAARNGKVRPLPLGNEPQLVDLNEGLLAKIDEVYDNTLPDLTSSLANPNGATVFINPFSEAAPATRRLVGKFGSLQFYE